MTVGHFVNRSHRESAIGVTYLGYCCQCEDGYFLPFALRGYGQGKLYMCVAGYCGYFPLVYMAIRIHGFYYP
jgi:hypothetical protein